MSEYELKDEQELIRAVFGNPKGKKLLEMWYFLYVERLSYLPANTAEQTAFMEGQRSFPLAIKAIMESKQ